MISRNYMLKILVTQLKRREKLFNKAKLLINLKRILFNHRLPNFLNRKNKSPTDSYQIQAGVANIHEMSSLASIQASDLLQSQLHHLHSLKTRQITTICLILVFYRQTTFQVQCFAIDPIKKYKIDPKTNRISSFSKSSELNNKIKQNNYLLEYQLSESQIKVYCSTSFKSKLTRTE